MTHQDHRAVIDKKGFGKANLILKLRAIHVIVWRG